jgi:ribonuclease BN (tRNA processing enzyme)
VWLDAGTGTLANLQRHVPIESVDAVVLSHEHADHWTDIEPFAVACRWYLGRTGYAPPGLAALSRAGHASAALDWHTTGDGEKVTVGALKLTFSQTDHPVTTLAMRIEGGKRSLGYSADSGPAWGLASLGAGLNLALCEATFLSNREGSLPHLSARQAGLTARAAGVERLVITHLTPNTDPEAAREEAVESFGAEVTVAHIGDRYLV